MDIDRRGKGQALVELAIGLAVATLVFSAILVFARIAVDAVDSDQRVRLDAGRNAIGMHGTDETYSSSTRNVTVEIGDATARRIFGKQRLTVRESAHIPAMGL